MPIMVRQSAPKWAVHTIYMVPSDFVLRDRFGVQADETTFMQNVENCLLIARQWFWDTTGGYTFAAVPALYFRSAKSTAQIFTDYTGEAYYKALVGGLGEIEAVGLFDRRSRHRLPEMYIPMNLEGGAVSIDSAKSYGCPFFGPGAVVGAGLLAGRTMGGLTPNFLSVPTTIATAAASGALTLQVAAGTGRNFAVAAGFGIEGSRVSSFTGSPTGATAIVCDDGKWAIGATPSQPIDAVMWPYGQEPTPSNAEAVQVTGVTVNTVTVVRARYGTTAITISAGGQGGGGACIYKRQQSARIWTSPGSPEAPGAEVVIVTGISGDTLTVQRGQADAALAGTTARAIPAGDNIAVTYPQSLNWAGQTVNQAIGGFVHELGHNFGMTHYNPEVVKHNPYVVEGPPGTYTVAYKDRSPTSPQPGNREQRPSVDSVTGASGYSVDFWEHLFHTPDNPLTPGLLAGPWVMFSWSNFPFGNVPAPAAGFTANELDRVLASPFLTAQARPTDPNIVTVNTFRSAGGAIGPVGGVIVPPGGGSGGPYRVQPVAWWGSDTANSNASFPTAQGYAHPFPSATFLAQVDASVLTVRRWYWDNVDHYTFDASPAVLFTSTETETALVSSHFGTDLVKTGMREADAALSVVDLTDPTQLNVCVTPLNNPRDELGGLNGFCFPGSTYGTSVTTDLPCGCATWGNYSTFAIGSMLGTPAGTGQASTKDFGLAILAHELGHAFGYDAAMPVIGDGDTTPTNFLPHRFDGTNPYILMARFLAAGLSGLGSSSLDATEKARMKASPFLTLHASRP